MRYSTNQKEGFQSSPVSRAVRAGLRVLLCLLAVGVVVSCLPPIGGNLGNLTVQVGGELPRTIVPSIDMNVASYGISGTGPNGATFSTSVTSGSTATISSLVVGTWSVAVDGKNAAGTFITHGTGTVQVAAATTTTLSVAVLPIAGPGSLSLTVSWPAASVAAPVIQAQLLPATGSAIPLPFSTPSNGSSTYSGSGIMNGYYTLTIQLFDGTVPVMGAVDVAEIVQGQTTAGTYAFTSINTARGIVTVNITPQLLNPITVTMTGQVADTGTGTPVTLAASVPAGTGNVTCAWYLNGVSKAVGASYTLNSATSPLAPGSYRVDVAVFTADGLRAGSATTNITVDPPLDPVNLAWNTNTETDLAGYKLYMGTTSGVYGTPTALGLVTTTTVGSLLSGQTYYFALTAYNTTGQESAKTTEIVYTAP
jgi:hypothetical protein